MNISRALAVAILLTALAVASPARAQSADTAVCARAGRTTAPHTQATVRQIESDTLRVIRTIRRSRLCIAVKPDTLARIDMVIKPA